VEHVNHNVSKTIVQKAAQSGKRLIVLEDLTLMPTSAQNSF